MAARQFFVSAGQRFGRGVVIRPEIRIPRQRNPGRADRGAVLRCDCGTVYNADMGQLRRGKIRSCGCLRSEVCRQMTAVDPADVTTGRILELREQGLTYAEISDQVGMSVTGVRKRHIAAEVNLPVPAAPKGTP